MEDGSSSPVVQSFLSSVDQFVSSLSSARVSMERQFQLQQVGLPEAVGQLSCPADYTAAGGTSGPDSRRLIPSNRQICTKFSVFTQTKSLLLLVPANNRELVERLEALVSAWTGQIKQVLTESEQMRKEADDVGPSAELEHWKRRMFTFNRFS